MNVDKLNGLTGLPSNFFHFAPKKDELYHQECITKITAARNFAIQNQMIDPLQTLFINFKSKFQMEIPSVP